MSARRATVEPFDWTKLTQAEFDALHKDIARGRAGVRWRGKQWELIRLPPVQKALFDEEA